MSHDPVPSDAHPWLADQHDVDARFRAAVADKLAASQAAAQALVATQTDELIAVANVLANCFRAGGRLFTMGNGGSACDAAHIALEFSHPVTAGRRALPAIHLGADAAMITAVANDVGIEFVFARQLQAQARAGDALIGVSTSGNSANLLAAFEQGARMGLTGIALSGAGGGAAAVHEGVAYRLVVPSDSVHRIQETHVLIYHILWDLVHAALAGPR